MSKLMEAPALGRLSLPFDPETMPASMRRLPVNVRGYPIPWFVDKAAPYVNGSPDFRVMDGAHLKTAIKEKRCWVCGGLLRSKIATFVAGPMCGVNRTNAEPPSHFDCAMWSARACPFLAYPKRIRDDRNLPVNSRSQAGVGIKRNPGVVMLWTCEGYRTWRPSGGGILFEFPDPIKVDWVCEGRAATRAEVMHSVKTGLPLLLKPAREQGADAVYALAQMTERFLAYVSVQ